MADTVNLPLVGTVPKGTLILTLGAGGAISGYLIYRSVKKKKAAQLAASKTTGGSAGASGYGYGGYGYGSSTPYGSQGYGYGAYGEFTPYPTAEAYGYGAYGYGYYNPITGQYLGPATSGETTTGGTAPTTNAQWTQDAIAILGTEGYQATTVQAALGAWLNNEQITSTQEQIVNAAIGAVGEPPDPPESTTTTPPTGQTTPGGSSVTVPNVVGKRQQQAVSTLKAAGLKSSTGPGFNSKQINKVGSQTPGAGTKVPAGTTVDIGDWTH